MNQTEQLIALIKKHQPITVPELAEKWPQKTIDNIRTMARKALLEGHISKAGMDGRSPQYGVDESCTPYKPKVPQNARKPKQDSQVCFYNPDRDKTAKPTETEYISMAEKARRLTKIANGKSTLSVGDYRKAGFECPEIKVKR